MNDRKHLLGFTDGSTNRYAYEVHGLSLSVVTNSKPAAQAVDSVLAPFSVASGEAATTCEVVVTRGWAARKAGCPAGMRRIWVGRLGDGARMTCWAGKGVRQLDVLGLASTVIDVRFRCAKITVREGEEWYIAGGPLLWVLSEFLRAVGHHIVHAASLVCNKYGGNKGVLIAGESGKGKTTAALALSGAGMKLLADDVTFVTKDDRGEGLAIWGLPRACKVHHKTLEMLKWLQDLPQRPAISLDEVLINVSEYYGYNCPTKAEPKIIIFLDERNTKEHRIKPLNKIDAIKILTRENVRTPDSNARGAIGETFRVLGTLVRRCDCYLLSAGPDVAGLDEIVTGLLR